MKQLVAIVLLVALASIATPQKSSHTMIAVVAHADDALTSHLFWRIIPDNARRFTWLR